VLVQDGEAQHTAAASLDEVIKYFIPCPAWPANSPAINLIEQSWGLIKNRLKRNGIRIREAIIAKLLEVWEQIPMDVINKPCESFPTRIEMMREAWGETIQPLLSSRQKSVPPNYLPDREHVVPLAPWTEDDDALLRRIREANPRMSWAHLADFFPGQAVSAVRTRWRILKTQALNVLNEETRNWQVMCLFLGYDGTAGFLMDMRYPTLFQVPQILESLVD
jgi:hypothetical protein